MPIQRSPCRDSGSAIRPVPTPISSSRVCRVADAAWTIPAALGIDRVAARYDATRSNEPTISPPSCGIHALPGR